MKKLCLLFFCLLTLISSAEVLGIWRIEKETNKVTRVYGDKELKIEVPEFLAVPGDDTRVYYWCFYTPDDPRSNVVDIWFPMPVRDGKIEIRESREKTFYFDEKIKPIKLIPTLEKVLSKR